MAKSSVDQFFSSDFQVFQPDSGYRFSVDPFLLCAHIQIQGHDRVIDIGTGCGIIPLILASRHPSVKISGIEIQKELYDFACKNISQHNLKDRIQIIHKDITETNQGDVGGPADAIISNPPYKKKGSGRLNPDSQKSIARHEISLDIDGVFNSAGALLKDKGSLSIIFPAERISDLMLSMTRYHFSAKMIRFVHTKKDQSAKRVILCMVKNQVVPCTIPPPLYIYEDEGEYSSEYLSFFNS